MSADFITDPAMAVKQAQDMEMVKRKMDVDAMRKHLTPGPDQKAKLREACQGFETMFIQKLWEEMRNNVPKEGYLHSKQEGMYQSMYDHEFSKKMAEAGGIGLGDMLYEQLSQSLGESARSKTPGASSRLPLIPASSPPSSMKYSGNAQQAAQIKPLYEDAAHPAAIGTVDMEQYAIHGAKNASGIAVTRGNPWQQAVGQLRADLPGQTDGAGAAAQMNGILTSGAAGQTADMAAADLDFEGISHEMLREELDPRASGASGQERETHNPVSAYARAFNRRHTAGVLTPEQSQTLAEALKENSRSIQSLQTGQTGSAGNGAQSASAETDLGEMAAGAGQGNG